MHSVVPRFVLFTLRASSAWAGFGFFYFRVFLDGASVPCVVHGGGAVHDDSPLFL